MNILLFSFFYSNPFVCFHFFFLQCQIAWSFLFFFTIFHPKPSLSIKLQWEQHLTFDKIWERIVLFHHFYRCSTRTFFFRSHFTSENRFGSTFAHYNWRLCKQSFIFILISFARIFFILQRCWKAFELSTQLQLANKGINAFTESVLINNADLSFAMKIIICHKNGP